MHEIKWIGEAPPLKEEETLVTVRLGSRHADLVRNEPLQVVLCDAPHIECGDECLVIGVGTVRAVWHGPLSSIPLKFGERGLEASTYGAIRLHLENVYGRKIKEREHVTCVAFILEAVYV
jgi:hypothetical protein